MDPEKYPAVQHERLGADGVAALAEVLASHTDDAVMPLIDRVEGRLTEECGQLRAEMTALRTELKTEIGDLRTELKADIADLRTEIADVRTEMRTEIGEVRTEIKALRLELRADFKVEVANARAELLKWSFVFWVGQVAAVVGLVTVLR